MAKTRTITQSILLNDELISGQIRLSAGSAPNIDETIPADSEEVAVAFALDVSECQMLFMVSDVDLQVTFEGPEEAIIDLRPNVPFLWFSNTNFAFPFDVDVTGLLITNSHPTSPARFRLEALVDPTP